MNPTTYTTRFPRNGRNRSTKFTTEYPSTPFTIREIVEQSPQNNYQMVYQRLTRDLKGGIITRIGKKEKTTSRGAKETIYQKN